LANSQKLFRLKKCLIESEKSNKEGLNGMIKLRQHALALHSCDVPGYKYEMATTWTMPRGCSATDVVYWINYAIDLSADLYLHNVVINCHGSPGAIHVGGCYDKKKGSGSKITLGDVAIFQSLRKRGAVGTIWIVACEVAKNKEGSTLGTDFCKQLAINAGCDVVAADKTQKVDFIFNNFRHPYGHIDDFEGIAYRFSPGGSVEVWSRED
jgi:hypothetical protein